MRYTMPYSDSSGAIFSFFPDDNSSFTMDHLLAALSSTSTICFFVITLVTLQRLVLFSFGLSQILLPNVLYFVFFKINH